MPSKTHRRYRSSEGTHTYGPPPLPKQTLHPDVAVSRSKSSASLRRGTRGEWKTEEEAGYESYFRLAIRKGELNFEKRFKNLTYLSGFRSKKNVFTICEEKMVSTLHGELTKLRRKGMQNRPSSSYFRHS